MVFTLANGLSYENQIEGIATWHSNYGALILAHSINCYINMFSHCINNGIVSLHASSPES